MAVLILCPRGHKSEKMLNRFNKSERQGNKYSRGVVKCDALSIKRLLRVQTSAQNHPVYSGFVSSRRQITAKISTFLHKTKKPGEVPSCYIYFVVSGSDSAAIAVFIPSLKPCSKAFSSCFIQNSYISSSSSSRR